ncbi:MAG: hypothetical protein ACM33T_12065 [Solirubrobacterales bacterium]
MLANTCRPFAPMRAAVQALRAADDAETIVAEAQRMRATAASLCDSVVILLNVAAADPTAGAVFTPEAPTLPVEALRAGRDALLDNLRRGCLYCGGASPFAWTVQ